MLDIFMGFAQTPPPPPPTTKNQMVHPLERSTGNWKVMGSTPVGGSESSFSEYFDLRTLLLYSNYSTHLAHAQTECPCAMC